MRERVKTGDTEDKVRAVMTSQIEDRRHRGTGQTPGLTWSDGKKKFLSMGWEESNKVENRISLQKLEGTMKLEYSVGLNGLRDTQ